MMAVSTSPTNAERAQSTRLGALCILSATTTEISDNDLLPNLTT